MPAPRSSAETSPRIPTPGRRPDWLRFLAAAILVAGAILVYGRTLSVPLIFDDDCITDDPSIRHWSTAFSPSNNSGAAGRPILNLSLAINYAISGTKVWSFHALNLAIHVLAGLTLFGIVRRTLRLCSGQALLGSGGAQACCALVDGRSKPATLRSDAAPQPDASLIGFSAAFLWTLHPLLTESVTWIIQRTESLMGLFYLLTLYCFIRGAESQEEVRCPSTSSGHSPPDSVACHERRPKAGVEWFALTVVTCLLGMATKEVMVSAPLMVLLYDRTFVAGSFQAAWRRRWVLHAGLASSWVLLAAVMISSQKRGGTVGFGLGVSPWEYALTQCRAVVLYLKLSVWPHPLVFDYGAALVHSLAGVWWQAIVVGSLLGLTIWALIRRPRSGFLGAWFFAILAPSSSVVPLVTQTVAEHRMYLPLAAVMTLAAIGIHAAVKRRSMAVVAMLALGLGLLTARRNEDYCSELTIWNDAVAKLPDNDRAHNNLGVVLSRMPGRLSDAIAQYREALRLNPDFAEAHHNLGLAWAQLPGRLDDAIAQYEAALRLKPDYAEAHDNLGLAWSQLPGRLDDAIAQYEAALRLKPDFAEAHNNLGLAWAQLPGRLDDAIAQYEAALRLKPDFAEAHNNLGIAWSQLPGRLDDAIAQYEAALRLKPDFVEAHFNLGIACSKTPGRLDDAVAQFEETLRLKPDSADAHNSLGVVWSKMPGRQNGAIAEFKAALRLKPDNPTAWHNLGVTCFHQGDLPAAAAAFREELRLSPDNPAARQALAAVIRRAEGH